jgi:hypothetical protein
MLFSDINIQITETAATIIGGIIGTALGALGRLAWSYNMQIRQDRIDSDARHDKDRTEIQLLTGKVIDLAVNSALATASTGRSVQEAVSRQIEMHADVRTIMQGMRDIRKGVLRLLKETDEEETNLTITAKDQK